MFTYHTYILMLECSSVQLFDVKFIKGYANYDIADIEMI